MGFQISVRAFAVLVMLDLGCFLVVLHLFEEALGEAHHLLVNDLKAIVGAVVGIDDLFAHFSAVVPEQQHLPRLLSLIVLGRAPEHMLQVRQVLSIHGEDVVKLGQVPQLNFPRAVTVVGDGVTPQGGHGPRVGRVADMIGTRPGGVDVCDGRVSLGQGAEDGFGHG